MQQHGSQKADEGSDVFQPRRISACSSDDVTRANEPCNNGRCDEESTSPDYGRPGFGQGYRVGTYSARVRHASRIQWRHFEEHDTGKDRSWRSGEQVSVDILYEYNSSACYRLQIITYLLLRFVSNGQLVPDELMLKAIGSELNRLSLADRSWLLDGFPRTKAQALSLFNVVPVHVVISLDVPFEVIINRVKGRINN